jgi:hypothetical protein
MTARVLVAMTTRPNVHANAPVFEIASISGIELFAVVCICSPESGNFVATVLRRKGDNECGKDAAGANAKRCDHQKPEA